MRADVDVTQMSWPAASARGNGRDYVVLAHVPGLRRFTDRNDERNLLSRKGKRKEKRLHM